MMIRKPDERRRTTQMWQFTEDSRLCPMSSTHLCVQSKEGIYGLREGGAHELIVCHKVLNTTVMVSVHTSAFVLINSIS